MPYSSTAKTVLSGIVVDVVEVVEVVDVVDVVVVSISWGADVSTVSSEAQETNIMTRIKDISFFLIAYKNTTILRY